MQKLAGVGVLLVAAVFVWVGVRLFRHPEFRFWRHPLLLGPFPRVRLTFGLMFTTTGLILVGVSLLLD